MFHSAFRAGVAMAAVLAMSQGCHAEDLPQITILLKNHRFTPSEITVPTGKPVLLLITNGDDTADEFEMRQLAIEKVIPPGTQGTVRIRPLGPGRFTFMGEFHAETAQGVIISK